MILLFPAHGGMVKHMECQEFPFLTFRMEYCLVSSLSYHGTGRLAGYFSACAIGDDSLLDDEPTVW
jgi:hypothetical protein